MIPCLAKMNTKFPVICRKQVISPFNISRRNHVPFYIAIMRSWQTPFIGTRTLRALEEHVVELVSNELSYGPYCSIVQSSGMGKSRLVDQFAKTNFLIPLNLREGIANEGVSSFSIMTSSPMFIGFPPPDNVIRDLLTRPGNDENKIYPRMLHFLFELFEKTSRVIADDLGEVMTRSQRIIAFRDFMTNGQNADGAGKTRQKFYDEIAATVETVSHLPIKFLILTFCRG
jgi:hypothetical protein